MQKKLTECETRLGTEAKSVQYDGAELVVTADGERVKDAVDVNTVPVPATSRINEKYLGGRSCCACMTERRSS